MSSDMSYEEMLALLREGGIDTDTFDQKSLKTLKQLHDEIVAFDIVLVHDHMRGRISRVATTVRVRITAQEDHFLLVEKKRVHPNGERSRENFDYSISETRKRGEGTSAAVVRGVWEECGIVINEGMVEYNAWYWPTRRESYYPSSTYNGIWTFAMYDVANVKLPCLPWKAKIVEDNGVQIHLEWIELTDLATSALT